MPRKKKKKTEEVVEDVIISKRVADLTPIAELLKNDNTILGERSREKLPRNAEFSPRFLDVATRLVSAGFSEKDLAFVLGTTLNRIRYWKRHNSLFCKACDDGKQVAKSYLIAQGLRNAAGYRSEEKNIKIKRKLMPDGSVVEYAAEESIFYKDVRGDSSLLIFMLCNMSRQLKDPEPWQSQHKIEIDQNKSVNIKISGKIASEQIDRLAGAFMPKEIIEAEFEDEQGTKKNKKIAGRSKPSAGSDTETHPEQ